MRKKQITVSVELSWDEKTEDEKGALAATFTAMGEGIANGKTTGPLPNKGKWSIGTGADMIR